jgi:DNA-binding NtrC family response regulator
VKEVELETKILLIEDDSGAGLAIKKVLSSEGFDVTLARRGDEGLKAAETLSFDIVITDLKLPGISGMELVTKIHASKPKLPIILITAHGTMETAIEAMKLGACEYLTKPFEVEELLDRVVDALHRSRLMTESVQIGNGDPNRLPLLGNSKGMQAIYKTIGRVAATPVTVLIRGATGTGKELIARAIYHYSDRVSKPFIAVNCAAIPKELLESELFGHERGAFTGAHNRRIGKFEQANRGTLFLDEIGDLNPDTQSKLLRVLQEHCIERVGGNNTVTVDVRVIAATHRDLEDAMKKGGFRDDLFHRLNVVTLEVPSLRERIEDIPELARFFVAKHGPLLNIVNPAISTEAIPVLQAQPWPGNVRELENTIREALLLARPFGISKPHITEILSRRLKVSETATQTHANYISHLLSLAEQGLVDGVFSRLVSDLEPELYSQAIKLAAGNQAKAARWLGVTRLKMREKLTEIGLH